MYIKGVTERFGFDIVESRKFKQLVKNKATGTLHGMFIYTLIGYLSFGCVLYTHQRAQQQKDFPTTVLLQEFHLHFFLQLL